MKDTFAPVGIRKALRTSRWTRMFFNQRGEFGVEGNAAVEGTAIPEGGYADHPSVSKYKTVGDLMKGHEEVTKLIGEKDRIVLRPKDDAKPEDIDKYYNSLGRPEKAEGYELGKLEGLHADIKSTPESEAGFKSMMHKHGLSAKQASGIYKDYNEMVSSALVKRDEGQTATKHETEKSLRADWGGEYDNNLGKAKRLIEKFGGKEGREAFGELGNNPGVLKIVASIANKFSEDGFIKGGAVTTTEKADAQKKLNDIMLNKEHPFYVKGVGHEEALAEVKKLHEILYPEVEA